MKRLFVLSMLVISTGLLSGCNRSWPRCWMFRGDECSAYPNNEAAPFMMEGTPVMSSGMPGGCCQEGMPGPAGAPATP